MSGGAFADTTLSSTITQPTIDRFQVNIFSINNESKEVSIVVQYGYDNAGTFVKEGGAVQYTISNEWVKRNNRFIARADNNGEFPQFPAAYQTNPANSVITNFIAENTAAGALGYLEAVVKQLGGL